MQTVELADEDSHAWQAAVSALRTHLPNLLQVRALCTASTPAAHARAEDLLHFARTFVSESVRREGVRHLQQKAGQNEAMGYLTSRLLSCLQESDILATLAEYLPPMGVRSCRVAFYIPRSKEDPLGESVFPATREEERGVHFPTREFPPQGHYPPGEPLNLAILPLCFQDEKLGYVAFDAGNLDPLAMIVQQLSIAVKNARLHAEVISLSLTDALSGISNRRYFDLIMEKEVERSQRYRRDLSVILIDVDLFKRYNDDFGHQAGDEALKEVARCIDRGTRRDLDVVSRYGGDEFAVILPETNVEGARIVAERIRGEVAGSTASLRPLSVSLGVGSHCGSLPSAKILLDRADQALYRVKQSGGNRVEVSANKEGTD
jgi:diguanylate cyclase (GGDEF)-like protein